MRKSEMRMRLRDKKKKKKKKRLRSSMNSALCFKMDMSFEAPAAPRAPASVHTYNINNLAASELEVEPDRKGETWQADKGKETHVMILIEIRECS